MPDKVGRPKKVKAKRVPFGARRSKLQVSEEFPGFVLRWFNDADGRIEQAQAAGYEFVLRNEVPSLGQGQLHQDNSDLNSKVSKVVSKGKAVPLRAYLMKIKEEWYEEDQAEKEVVNAEIDEALRQGAPGGNVVDKNGTCVTVRLIIRAGVGQFGRLRPHVPHVLLFNEGQYQAEARRPARAIN